MAKWQNHPFVVWASCLLLIIAILSITWSLVLFFYMGEILLMCKIMIVNSFTLLCGIMMLPSLVFILFSIAHCETVKYSDKILCCPAWLSISSIVIVSIVGAVLCAIRIQSCHQVTSQAINQSMVHYRSVPRYKRFIDNVQWSLKCCGLYSYKDWFQRDWYDKIRDYEWDPSPKIKKRDKPFTDSVPLSCCRSGSCISNYLQELGTHSINTRGCGEHVRKLVLIAMTVHLFVFVLIALLELLILKFIIKRCDEDDNFGKREKKYNVRHIMTVNDNFDVSSDSFQINPEEGDSSREDGPILLQN